MSRRIGELTIIEAEPDNLCHLCGKIAESRPYGPGFQEICFECGIKNEPLTTKRMQHKLFGAPIEQKDVGEL